MIISHQHKFIFIKTRKTAGSSIEKYLSKHLGPNDICSGSEQDNTPRLNTTEKSGHKGWNYFKKKHEHAWTNYFTFAIERNPWDKMVSQFYWLRRSRSFKVRRGFNTFIIERAHEYNDWSKYAIGDKIMVDSLIKYEKLHDSFLQLPIPYNNDLQKTFVKKNNIRPLNYRDMYDAITKRKVAEAFGNVIEHFKYEF